MTTRRVRHASLGEKSTQEMRISTSRWERALHPRPDRSEGENHVGEDQLVCAVFVACSDRCPWEWCALEPTTRPCRGQERRLPAAMTGSDPNAPYRAACKKNCAAPPISPRPSGRAGDPGWRGSPGCLAAQRGHAQDDTSGGNTAPPRVFFDKRGSVRLNGALKKRTTSIILLARERSRLLRQPSADDSPPIRLRRWSSQA